MHSKRCNYFNLNFYIQTNKKLTQNFHSSVNFWRKMLKFLHLLIFYVNFVNSARSGDAAYNKFTWVKWTASNISASSYKCFLKAYSRRNVTVTVFANISRSLYDYKMRHELLFSDIGNAKRTIINETIDMCAFLNGTNTNVLFKWIVGVLDANFKKYVHPCPYFVRFSMNFLKTKKNFNYFSGRFRNEKH